MLRINDELKKHNLVAKKYLKKGNVTIITTNEGVYVFKRNSNNDIYKYLESRNFLYYPDIIYNDEYLVTKYITDLDIPKEQKIDDMIDLISLLHNKTTHFKCVSIDDYKKIYEDMKNNVSYLYEYYNDLMTVIESKIYMAPYEYFLSLNISKVYEALNYANYTLDLWYEKIKDEKKMRLAILHNNLNLDHYIYDDKPYLISWDKAKIDMPIFDLYKLYKNNHDFDFGEALKRYEKKYPLKEDERYLLFILLALPDKIELTNSSFKNMVLINDLINMIDKTKDLILPYNLKDTEKN